MITVARYGLIIIMALTIIFHFCILLKIVPYSIVWGGRLKTDKEMYRFEAVSILINFIFLFIVLIQAGVTGIKIPAHIMTWCMWFMAALFFLNTLGNFASKNRMEKMVFTPLTIILTILCGILALLNQA